jgi:hypothetical protein
VLTNLAIPSLPPISSSEIPEYKTEIFHCSVTSITEESSELLGYGILHLKPCIKSSTPKTEVTGSSETLVTTYKTAKCHNPEDHTPHFHSHGNTDHM